MEPTSNNARKSARESRSDPAGNDYLANQIADARLALESTLDDLTLDVARASDLRRWVRRYPWAALGTALVAGFTLGHVITKSRRRAVPASATQLEDVPAEQVNEFTAAKPGKKPTHRQEPTGAWRASLLNALFDILRVAVTQFISASARRAASGAIHPRPTPSHGGADAAPNQATDAGPDGSEQTTPAS